MNRTTLMAMVDALAAILLIFVLLPHQPEADENTPPPGNVAIEIRWPDGYGSDVDLWCRGPDGVAVGYSNKSSQTMNLLRDDLGTYNDLGGLNYENCFSRGLVEGEYVANVHLFAPKVGETPLPVVMRVAIRGLRGSVTRVGEFNVTLSRGGQEVTVVRFSLDRFGQVIDGSIHNTPVNLRASRGYSLP